MLDFMKFKKPDFGYYPVPFWFWNDDLPYDNLEWQLEQMKEQHIYEYFIHARKGLLVPYLSEEWFSRIKFVIEKSKELDMKVWIYDEDNFPSGYAGGKVLQQNPDYCGKYLRMSICKKEEIPFKTSKEKCVAVYLKTQDGFKKTENDVLQQIDREQDFYLFTQGYTKWHPAYTDDYYVDMLNKDATKAFIACTHEAYRERLGSYFGTVIKGFFSDEAGFYNNLKLLPWSNEDDSDTIVWTDDYPRFFKDQNGYDIFELLPYIWIENEHYSSRVRSDFHNTACKMYKENFLFPQKEYCENYGMKFVGHLHMEDFMHMQILTQGDFTSAMDGLSYAGTDRIDLNPEKINEKLVSSIGHQYGKERVLSESFALSSWAFHFGDMKRWANYQYVRGINMLVPHAFFASIEGERMWECPPSQFYQNPYWGYYKGFADYIARLSYILSQGTHVADLAVYYPIKSAQAMLRPDDWDDVIALDQFIQNVSFALLDEQFDFDFINDDALNDAKKDNGLLAVGKENYKALLIPDALYLPLKSLQSIYDFALSGGAVIFLKTKPKLCIDERIQLEYTSIFEKLTKFPTVTLIEKGMLYKAYTYCFNVEIFETVLKSIITFEKDLLLKNPDRHIKYLHRRDENQDIYFIINEDSKSRENTISIKNDKKPIIFDAESGKKFIYEDFVSSNGRVDIHLTLEPYDSVIIVFGDDTGEGVEKILPLRLKENRNQSKKIDVLNFEWKITKEEQTFSSKLASWEEFGFPYFSGQVDYELIYTLENREDYQEIQLQLGEVCDFAQVWVNDIDMGAVLWTPFSFDVKEAIKNGINSIKVRVINSLINEYEKKPKKSGLIGPVSIQLYKNTNSYTKGC